MLLNHKSARHSTTGQAYPLCVFVSEMQRLTLVIVLVVSAAVAASARTFSDLDCELSSVAV